MAKKGRKQATVRQKLSEKRKSGFRGTPKQVLQRRNEQQRPTIGITFVGEDDVVSEQIPPPPVPASSRKLQLSDSESSSEEISYDGRESASGYRFISMDSLQEFINRIHSHSCSSGHVELEEDGTRRTGMSCFVCAKCDTCGMSESFATGYHTLDAATPNTAQGKDINRRVVFSAFEMGTGREGIAKLCEVLDMPFSISIDTWYRHEDALLQAHEGVLQEELAKNRTEARRTEKQYKDYRTLRRQAKQRDEELRTNREGVTYEAGAFNDLGVCSAPPPKKRKR